VVIFITLLAGFVPLLQVTFFALLEDYLSGLTRCERSGQNSKDHRRDPYHTVTNIKKKNHVLKIFGALAYSKAFPRTKVRFGF
jgi:hypothetical protein